MSLIKGIREKLFNKLSINVSEIKLKDIAKLYQPETISKNKMNNSLKYNVYGANGIIGKTNSYNHENEQICIGCRGTVGNVFLTKKNSWINGNAMVINIDNNLNKINKKYIYYYLLNCNFKYIVSGSSQPQIVRSPLENFKIKIPVKETQDNIVKTILSFEKALNNEKNKYVKYKIIKSYLLGNMFI